MDDAHARKVASRFPSPFDRFTIMTGRRGVVAALSALPALAMSFEWGSAGPPGLFCGEQAKGERCRKNGQCCSGRCKRKKHKRNGTCRCSALGARCGANTDCCGHEMGTNTTPLCSVKSLGASARCCFDVAGAPCQKDEDCCGERFCGAAGTCDL